MNTTTRSSSEITIRAGRRYRSPRTRGTSGAAVDSVYICTYTRRVSDEVPEWTWDLEKAIANRRKHGISLVEAVIALEDPLALTVPDRTRGEERLVTIGQDSEGALIVVAWVAQKRGGRILSARKATPRERRNYEEER